MVTKEGVFWFERSLDTSQTLAAINDGACILTEVPKKKNHHFFPLTSNLFLKGEVLVS
jgi:hypothetical protein